MHKRAQKGLKTAFPDWKTKAQQVNTRKWEVQLKCQSSKWFELPFLLLWGVWGWSCWALADEADLHSWAAVKVLGKKHRHEAEGRCPVAALKAPQAEAGLWLLKGEKGLMLSVFLLLTPHRGATDVHAEKRLFDSVSNATSTAQLIDSF